MRKRTVDYTGQRFGRLVVLKEGEGKRSKGGKFHRTWICKCDCGNITEVKGFSLKAGKTISCGCAHYDNKGGFKNITGQKYGRLTVIRYIPKNERTDIKKTWLCQCECGNYIELTASKIGTGHTTSCGCANKIYKHSCPRLYSVYKAMISRCYDTTSREYHNYGGRGIHICEEWMGTSGFDNFADWAFSNGYDENAKRGEHTIERKDVDKNYSPNNCCWITLAQQARNKRNTIWCEYKGQTKSLVEWVEILDVSYSPLRKAIKEGKSVEEYLRDYKPRKRKKNI